MKTINYIYITFIVLCLMGCAQNSDKKQSHEGHETEAAHEHADGETCSGDSAASQENHDEHDQAVEDDGHNHAPGESCAGDHAAEDDGLGNEIILTEAQRRAGGVEVTEIAPKAFSDIIRTSGRVLSAQGDEKVVVATSSGIVSFGKGSLLPGASVRQGATLLSISGQKMLEGDPAERLRIEYNRAKVEYDRAQKLVKDKIISEKEFNAIRRDYDAARLAYNATGAQQSGAGVAVVSPLSGFVKNCLAKDGEYVAAGTPLLTVSQNKRLTLQAEVSERNYTKLSAIRTAKFKLPYSDNIFDLNNLNGRLLSVGRTATDNNSAYIPVSFEFDNKGNIIPGSYVEVYLQTTPINDAIVLPSSAITEEQGLYFVYKQIDAEGFKRQPVTLGGNSGDEVQILSGVVPGNKIVTRGAYQVKLASASGAAIPHGHAH